MTTDSPITFTIATAPTPGAIGVIQLYGPARPLIERLMGRRVTGSCVVGDLGGIDEGVVAALDEQWWQVMPHGGVRVMQRLAERLCELGAKPLEDAAARRVYPEAGTELEADMLAAMARAASPAAIDLLLEQPGLWREAAEGGGIDAATVLADSAVLDRLIDPPTVVLCGRANVGKSTLTNRVMGRSASVTADLPGTTRDWVAGLALLPGPLGLTAVRWFDTPGLRQSDDAIERRAMELAAGVMGEAAVLIEMRDPMQQWLEPGSLPRRPDLRVMNKSDLPGADEAGSAAAGDEVLRISAATGQGVARLCEAIAGSLGLSGSMGGRLWAFSPSLRVLAGRVDMRNLRRYAGGGR